MTLIPKSTAHISPFTCNGNHPSSTRCRIHRYGSYVSLVILFWGTNSCSKHNSNMSFSRNTSAHILLPNYTVLLHRRKHLQYLCGRSLCTWQKRICTWCPPWVIMLVSLVRQPFIYELLHALLCNSVEKQTAVNVPVSPNWYIFRLLIFGATCQLFIRTLNCKLQSCLNTLVHTLVSFVASDSGMFLAFPPLL